MKEGVRWSAKKAERIMGCDLEGEKGHRKPFVASGVEAKMNNVRRNQWIGHA